MLRKVTVTRALGLGIIFAIVTISSAMADEAEVLDKISKLAAAFQRQADKTDEALQKQDERLKKLEARFIPKDHGDGPARVVHIHRHYYYPRYWCPPPWWGPW